ncbi:MAG: right-handed parallel beta-helix repeat-containing protein [Patescibacteria group bacterium]|nr:right-handed parallel beta-helix repeat-containing protein [Patescibacteria group bacterium]
MSKRQLTIEPLERREMLSASYGVTAPVGPQPGVNAPAGAIVFMPRESASQIESAVSHAGPDRTFYFDRGTYQNVSITPLAGDTFIGQQGALLTSRTQAEAFMSSASNVTIDNLAFTGYVPQWPFSTIHANLATGWTVENVDVSGSADRGVTLFDGGKLLNSYVHGNAVLGVKIDGLAGYAGEPEYLTTEGAPVTIENDNISGNNPHGAGNVEFEAGGIKLWSANNVSIVDCTISNNVGNGVWIDTCFAGDVVQGCLVQNNTSWGVENEISNGTQITQNYISGNGVLHSGDSWPLGGGIGVDDSANALVSENTVLNDGNSICTFNDTRTDDGFNWQLVGVVISSNTVTMSAGHNGSYWSDPAGGTQTQVDWTANTYHVSGSAAFVWNNWQAIDLTLAQWQAVGND